MSPASSNDLQPPLNRASWMDEHAALLDPLALTQICLPGAHNAGTFGVRSWSDFGCDAPGILKKQSKRGSVARAFAKGTTARWARCQNMSVYDQLKFGIRYFDFRLAPNPKQNGDLYISHSMFSDSLTAVVEDVYHFITSDEGKNEFVILDFQAIFLTTDAEMEEKFYTPMSSLSRYCVANEIPLSTPLQVMRSRSTEERLFVIVDRDFPLERRPKMLPRRAFLQSKWKDKRSVKELIKAFDDELCDAPKEAAAPVPARFHVTQAVLTPTALEVIRGLLLGYRPSLQQLTRKANTRLLHWYHNRNTAKNEEKSTAPTNDWRYCNVIMIDFVEEARVTVDDVGDAGGAATADLVQLCVLLNTARSPRMAC